MIDEIPTIRLVGCTCSRDYSKKSHSYASYKLKESKYQFILVCKKCGKYSHVPKIEFIIKKLDDNDQIIWTQAQMVEFLKSMEEK